MKLRFFGRLREALGTGELELEIPAAISDSDALRSWLGADYPALCGPTVRLALDDSIVTTCQPLGTAREAAFLPPVSGG